MNKFNIGDIVTVKLKIVGISYGFSKKFAADIYLKIKKDKEDEERELRNQHENTINEYESKLQKYEEKVSDLEYKICVSFPDDELCR